MKEKDIDRLHKVCERCTDSSDFGYEWNKRWKGTEE